MKKLISRMQDNFHAEMHSLTTTMQNTRTDGYASKIDNLTAQIQGIKKDTQETKSKFDSFINALWKQTKPVASQPCSNGMSFNYAKTVAIMLEAAIKSIGMAK